MKDARRNVLESYWEQDILRINWNDDEVEDNETLENNLNLHINEDAEMEEDFDLVYDNEPEVPTTSDLERILQ